MTPLSPLPRVRKRLTVLAAATTRPLALAELTTRESCHLASLAGESRRRQWLTSRRALRLILGVTGLPYRTTGCTFPHRRLSLAHTDGAGIAAAAVGAIPATLTGIGVDIEPKRDADPRTARFFLSEREQAWLNSVPLQARAEHQVRLWTVKEALFKADTANQRSILRDYTVLRPAADKGCGLKGPPAKRDPAAVFGYVHTRLAGVHLSIAAAFRRDRPTPRRDMRTSVITFEDVAERISATLSIPVSELKPKTTLQDLAADSFLLVEMVIDLQEEFDAMFTQTELREVANLSDLVDLLRSPHEPEETDRKTTD
jgi:acyl carrier protein